jgi:hypothetical protein
MSKIPTAIFDYHKAHKGLITEKVFTQMFEDDEDGLQTFFATNYDENLEWLDEHWPEVYMVFMKLRDEL